MGRENDEKRPPRALAAGTGVFLPIVLGVLVLAPDTPPGASDVSHILLRLLLFGWSYLFVGSLFGFAWPPYSWKWGIWLIWPLLGSLPLLAVDALTSQRLGSFALFIGVGIALAAAAPACGGAFVASRLAVLKDVRKPISLSVLLLGLIILLIPIASALF